MTQHDTCAVFHRVRDGDEAAARELFERYLSHLVALARSRLSDKLARKVDADDVVQSAFGSFFVRARDGQYAIQRAGDVWRLLVSITHNKLLKQAERFRQQKRDLQRDQALAVDDRSDAIPDFAQVPTYAEAVALADEIEFLMRDLEPFQRRMVELRLQGRTIPEIADVVERAERTVRRFLGQFRDMLEQRLIALKTG